VKKIFVVLFALGTLLFAGFLFATSVSSQIGEETLSITSVDVPIVNDQYLFWQDESNHTTAVLGYDKEKKSKFSIVAKSGTTTNSTLGKKYSLVGVDGNILIYFVRSQNGGYTDSVQGYNFITGKGFDIIPPNSASVIASGKVSNGVLYYEDVTPGHTGIFGRELSTGQEELITPTGYGVKVDNGILLWQELTNVGQYQISESNLHLVKLDKKGKKISNGKIIATAHGDFRASISDDNIVWTVNGPGDDQKVRLYNISQNKTRTISTSRALNPVIKGSKVVWTVDLTGAPGKPNRWAVEEHDLNKGITTTLVKESSAELQTLALDIKDRVILSVRKEAGKPLMELHIVQLGQTGLQFDATNPSPSVSPKTIGASCGQVTATQYNYYLYDYCGRWKVNGVQFVLPQAGGIAQNGFFDNAYNQAANDGSLEYWLEKAQNYLLAKNLRIFIDMPYDDGSTSTSIYTVYDFIKRADQRNMRVGLVINNLHRQNFKFLSPQKNWLTNLFNLLNVGDASHAGGYLSSISYIGILNEANNQCVRPITVGDGYSCFDNSVWTTMTMGYIDQVSTYIHNYNVSIPVTVGISTELSRADGHPASEDFFRAGTYNKNISSMVNFISPHDYGGHGYDIYNHLRYDFSYPNQMVLEEFGWPTDPISIRNPGYSELPEPACSDFDPYDINANPSCIC